MNTDLRTAWEESSSYTWQHSVWLNDILQRNILFEEYFLPETSAQLGKDSLNQISSEM